MSRIDEIKERLEAATPGPWKWEAMDESMLVLRGPDIMQHWVLACTRCRACIEHKRDCFWPKRNNSDFIANAPDDIDNLLAELARYKRALEIAARVYLADYILLDCNAEDVDAEHASMQAGAWLEEAGQV